MSSFTSFFISSKKTDQGWDLEFNDARIQLHEDMSLAWAECKDQEKLLDSFNNFLMLCDSIENNDAKLDAAVESFVNHNGELSKALGIDIAQEDASQQNPENNETGNSNGKKIIQKKTGIVKQIWFAIKAFIGTVINAIGNVFKWLSEVFSSTSQKAVWLVKDGDAIAAKIGKMSKEQIYAALETPAIGKQQHQKAAIAGMVEAAEDVAKEDFDEEHGNKNNVGHRLEIKSADELFALARNGKALAENILNYVHSAITADIDTMAALRTSLHNDIRRLIPDAPDGSLDLRLIIQIPSRKDVRKPQDVDSIINSNWFSDRSRKEILDVKRELEAFTKAMTPCTKALNELNAHIEATKQNLDTINDTEAKEMNNRVKSIGKEICDGTKFCGNLGKCYVSWVTNAYELFQQLGMSVQEK